MPEALDGCVGPKQAHLTYVAGPGVWVPVALLGHGPRVVVLSEQSDKLACDWLPFAHVLTSAGFRVALYDSVGGESPAVTLEHVIRKTRALGTTDECLVGASQGAKASLIAAAAPHPVDCVVALSAERDLDGRDVDTSVRHLTAPVLLVSSRHDPYGSADADRVFLRDAPAHDKRLIWEPGSRHGVDLLHGPRGAALKKTIVAFLAKHTRG